MPYGTVLFVRDAIVKLLILLVLSANLGWAVGQGAEMNHVGVADMVASPESGERDNHHPAGDYSQHCCHASVHFTGLPDTSVSIPAGALSIAPLAAFTNWQSRDVEPRLRPPRA